jgi:hypothetical protein
VLRNASTTGLEQGGGREGGLHSFSTAQKQEFSSTCPVSQCLHITWRHASSLNFSSLDPVTLDIQVLSYNSQIACSLQDYHTRVGDRNQGTQQPRTLLDNILEPRGQQSITGRPGILSLRASTSGPPMRGFRSAHTGLPPFPT